MPDSLNKVLIPIDVSGSISRYEIVTETVQSSEVVLLGYWPVPDQSVSDQLRDQFEEEAQQRLQTLADRFIDDGVPVQTRLVFTKDREHIIDAAANKYDCESILIPGTETRSSGAARGLVLVKPDADLNRITTTLGALFANNDVELHLFHSAANENKHLHDATEFMLRGLADQLEELGIDPDRIEWEQSTEGDRLEMILSRVSDCDFVILGETKPSVRERIFGSVQATLAEQTEKPQLTIRTGV